MTKWNPFVHMYWTRRHLVEMTRAYVIYFPTAAATATTAPIFPN